MNKTEILRTAVLENLNKPKEDRLTGKRLGEIHGVSGARISQVASGLKVKAPVIPSPTPEVTESSEGV